MHILYLQQLLTLPGSKGTQRSWEMAKHWQEAGHEVSIIASSALIDTFQLGVPLSQDYFSLDYEGIQLHLLDIPYSHFFSYKVRLRAFYAFYRQAYKIGKKLTGVDLVLAYSAPLSTGFLGRRLSEKLSCPFVFEVADVWPDVPAGMRILKNPALLRLLRWQTNKTYKAAAAIFTFTEGMKGQILTHGIDSFKVHVIHNGANVSAYNPVPGPEPNNVKVVYTGSLGPANGISQLLYAWRRIEKKWSNKVSCHILGEGTEEVSLQELATELGLRSLFFHKPIPQDEIDTFLKTADIGLVCIAPFKVLEANGATKAFEYMASGIPLVINYEGWLADYLSEYNCGLAAPLGHVEKFAQKINRLILEKDLRIEMGRNGRQLCEDKFDRKDLARKMLDFFEEIGSFI